MTTTTLLGIFTYPGKDPLDHDVNLILTISIEKMGSWSGNSAPISIDGQYDIAAPLIICHKDDVIHLQMSSSSTYTPVITALQKVSGDDVVVLRSGPAAVSRIADTTQQGSERFSIIFQWLEDNESSNNTFIVDPYISCN